MTTVVKVSDALDASTSGPTVDKDWSWRSEGYAWFVVSLLTAGFTLSIIDRTILVLFVEPIKRDLGINDTQFSLLYGLAFTMLYAVAGMPLGRLTDRYSRRTIIGLSILGWSVATCACGRAASFWQLFVFRVGVGVGEAGLAPAGTSMITDYFPRSRLARPMATFSAGGLAGGGLALIFGGGLVALATAVGDVQLPVLGMVRGWQMVFLLLGFGGSFFALVFLAVKEPPRGGAGGEAPATVRDAAAFTVKHADFYLPYWVAMGLMTLVNVGYGAWAPSHFIRNFGWSASETGYIYGAVVLVGGVLGIGLTSWAAEVMHRRGRTDGHVRVATMAALAAIIPAAVAPLIPNAWGSLAMLAVALVFLPVPVSLAPIAMHTVSPNRMRGQIFSVYVIVQSVLGWVLGPFVVAVLTDYVFRDTGAVRYSLAVVAATALPLAAFFMAYARRAYLRYERAAAPQ